VIEIGRLGNKAFPNEACGVILPIPWCGNQVIGLPNLAEDPTSHFQLNGLVIHKAIEGWLDIAEPMDLSNIIIWHTHPKGNIGPSIPDIRNKLDGVYYLVVALTEEGPCPTIY